MALITNCLSITLFGQSKLPPFISPFEGGQGDVREGWGGFLKNRFSNHNSFYRGVI